MSINIFFLYILKKLQNNTPSQLPRYYTPILTEFKRSSSAFQEKIFLIDDKH